MLFKIVSFQIPIVITIIYLQLLTLSYTQQLQSNATPTDTFNNKAFPTQIQNLHQQISQLHKPDFLLIGVVKSGSTSLYHYLLQHPQITGVEQKYIVPQNIRTNILKIINLRKSGAIPDPKPTPNSKTVPHSIYNISNFELSRFLKPIIDQKEVRFFDSFWYQNLQTLANNSLQTAWKWYLNVFHQNSTQNVMRMEASPTYFTGSSFSAPLIKQWLPECKLILLLRNPVQRFISHLKMVKENRKLIEKFRGERMQTIHTGHPISDNIRDGELNPFNS